MFGLDGSYSHHKVDPLMFVVKFNFEWITLAVKQISGITKKTYLGYKRTKYANIHFASHISSIHVQKWTSVKHDLSPCLACNRKSPPQRRLKEETDRQYFWAKVDLARSLLDKQLAFNGTLLEVNNEIQQRSHLGCHAMLCRDELTACRQKFA